MSIQNLDKIFAPERIAVFGASNTTSSVGYTVLRNLISSGFAGVVYPVNPKRESIQGIQAYPDTASLPNVPDLAVICTPAVTVPGIIRSCGEAGTRGILIISAGFREVGAEGRALEAKVLEEQKKFKGMRILGPNCLGIMVPGHNLNASFAASAPLKGNVGFISQSGALCTSVLDWANDEGIGFSYFISVGNAIDVSMGDLIDYLGISGTNAIDHSVRRIDHGRTRVHVGGAGLFPHQADRGLQRRAVRRIGSGCGVAHGRIGRCGCRLRRGLSPSGDRTDQ